MSEKKYEKYVTTDVLEDSNWIRGGKSYWVRGSKVWDGVPYEIGMRYHERPMKPKRLSNSHKHDFDQILGFLGSNPDDMAEFDAELHIYLGEEREKYIITSPCAILVPAGLYHCPLEFVKVNKPFFFYEVNMTAKYVREEGD